MILIEATIDHMGYFWGAYSRSQSTSLIFSSIRVDDVRYVNVKPI